MANTKDDEADDYFLTRDEEFATRYPSPLPSPGDKLFVKDQDAERKFLHEKFPPPYIDGYKKAAEILLEHVRSERVRARLLSEQHPGDSLPFDPSHWLAYPIYFSFRQSIELSLKDLVKTQQAKNPLPEDKEKKVHHDLKQLWDEIKPWALNRLRGQAEATEAFEALLEEIQCQDKGADAGRFPLRRVGKKGFQPSFDAYAPLSIDAIESACVKMLNYIQRSGPPSRMTRLPLAD
jgi:hypothetical protein